MDFGLSPEQELFAHSLRGYLSQHFPMQRVRTLMEAEHRADPERIEALSGQGLAGILVPTDCGGSGLALLDAVIAAVELGRAATPVSFHSAFVAAPYLLSQALPEPSMRGWLEAIAAGKSLLSFARLPAKASSGKWNGSASFVADAMVADAFVVASGDDSAPEFYLLPAATPGLSVEPLLNIDATRVLGDVSFEAVALPARSRLPIADPAGALRRVLDAGRIVLAADAFGAAERSLESAVEYSLLREQFGRLIGSFQAVKHMCAESYAELEPLRALLWYAAFAWDEELDDASYAATLLKSHCCEVATEVVANAVQVYGGMGFTYDCDVQIWFKRAGYDRQMWGGPSELRARAVEMARAGV